MSVFCSVADTVGESFELNIAAVQEAGTLVGTAKPIILSQGSVWEKWNIAIPAQLRRAAMFRLAPLQFASNDSPTVSIATQTPSTGPVNGCACRSIIENDSRKAGRLALAAWSKRTAAPGARAKTRGASVSSITAKQRRAPISRRPMAHNA